MELTVWTYEGPPHVGAMRVAASMRNVHYVLHAPQGDTYADLLFTMIERRKSRPPVTYTTFQARDLSGDTAEIFKTSCREAAERFQPEAMLVGASCTAELIQDDPGGLAKTLGLPMPVIPLELPSYQKKENWGAAETFYRLVRTFAVNASANMPQKNTCNILGPTSLGFRNRDDVTELRQLLQDIGIEINVVAPLGASPSDLGNIPEAAFNIILYPEIAETAGRWLERTYGQPMVMATPMGVGGTNDFIEQVQTLAGLEPSSDKVVTNDRLSWYSRSIDSNYLTGKRVFIYGDGTHAIAAARIASEELGFKVCGLGTYSRERGRDLRAAASNYDIDPLITDNHLDVEDAIIAAQPELILGTQMERHVAKRLRIPCAVISNPVHVQDFPARYSPQMGFEGANVIFDSWVHPLMMGLEEHLLQMFRDDFEFNDDADASHLAAHSTQNTSQSVEPEAQENQSSDKQPIDLLSWTTDAERELKKIPFFVRGKARKNTENFAAQRGLNPITVETLYDAKAHFGR